jgi:nucleoside-diphosphate-sugar epimerase
MENKRIFVTGGQGFIGSHLVSTLRSLGAEVIAPSHSECDLTIRPMLDHYIDVHQPFDYCFHLAARIGGIRANMNQGGDFFRDNITMGINIIQSCLTHRVGSLIFVGSACSYPADAPLPFREGSLFDGYPEPTNAPYGIAKRALLAMLQGYRDQYGMRGAYPVPTNCYGPGDSFHPLTSHVIPAVINKALAIENGKSDTLSLWGTGSPTRDFLYVDDLIQGFILLAKQDTRFTPVNLGSGTEISILDLAHRVLDIMDLDFPIICSGGNLDGQARRCLDITMAGNLGWTPTTPLHTGLQKTIEWRRKHVQE